MEGSEMRQDLNDTLWVLAQVKKSIYAIDGVQVESILVLDQEIIRLPDSNDLQLGTILFRGGAIPVLNLRCIVGMESRSTEQSKFEQMLDDRKQDHIRWVETLKNSVASGEPFMLATDPHQCAFGQWYDLYEADNQTVAFHLKKIDEPHRNLHHMAVEMLSCKQEHNTCMRAECLKHSLKKAVEIYMPQVVRFIEEAKQVFRDNYRKIVVVLSNETSTCGILVDEVLSAEPLGTMTKTYTRLGNETDAIVTHIGERKENTESVLILNLNQLFEKYL